MSEIKIGVLELRPFLSDLVNVYRGKGEKVVVEFFDDVKEWCTETFGYLPEIDNKGYDEGLIFRDIEHAALFKLRWML